MNNGMSYEDKIINAIETIVDNKVENANYDKTIQAQIISCVDATIGKYKVQYQDSTFYAYSGSSDLVFSDGAEVYILIPGNDMSRDKTILGTTKKLGVNYTNPIDEEEAYEIIGNNCIDSSASFELCSYRPETRVIYDRNSEDNAIRLNLTSIETYIRQSSSIICAANIKTSLPTEQQFRGNYGIVFELTFLDNASQDLVTRSYILDVNQFEGNPYKILNFRRQYGIYDIDAASFQYVNRIYLFVYDFPRVSDDMPADIFIKDLEFCGGVASSAEELASCGLVFITPKGTYFDDNDLPTDGRPLQAQVRVKGKNIDNESQRLSFYWFVENVGVTSSSTKYCSYGGQGWQCLNNFNLVQSEEGKDPVVEWVPASYEYIVKKADSEARETKYKCVVLYDDIKLSKEIVITNYSSQYEITIGSDGGTQFYYDIGNPTLSCLINGDLKADEDFSYMWAVVDNSNNFSSLAETINENLEYNNAVAAYNQLLQDIQDEKAMAAASQEQLEEYLTIIEKYDKIMRVEGKFLHHVQISSITNFNTYKCSVYYKGVFIGTGSIVLNNTLDVQDAYSIVINNGSQVFKYNEAGVAPTSSALDTPLTLPALSFTIYDNLGRALEDDVVKNCDIQWIVPTEETLLNIPDGQGNPENVDLINHTETYKNILQLSYTIASKYNIRYKNNTIKLIVNYNGMSLTTQTDFTFAKEGEPGTNGTEFLCKIVPNIASGVAPLYPMILNGELNYTPRNASRWFNVQLWHDGEKIYEGTSPGTTTENKGIVVLWSILANKYNATQSDNTDIEVTDAQNGEFLYKGYTNESSPANIIKCSVTYDDITYYATMPLITATTASGYKIRLKDNTGFRYATYTTDGRSPEYDNSHPFELEVLKSISGFDEDVSELEGPESVNYNWNVRGKIYNPVTREWDESIHLTEALTLGSSEMKRNQKAYKPIDSFNGECLNNALEVFVTNVDGDEVAAIHIPIHLLLNKYGNAAINGWDGNHISIDENGSGVILAPQVGAGIKESDNSFTGTLMGQVKESGKSVTEVGLFGYSSGARTYFLNAEDGSAIFGKAGKGQIIIDPTQDLSYIYSSNYWKNYDVYGKPSNYSSGNENGEGMLIDLTTPKIKWGNGNFVVNEEGHITAKGGGDIAGWLVDDYKLYKEKTGMSSVDDATAEGVTKYDIKIPYATGNETGYITDSRPVAFWAGKDEFFVTHDGYLKANEASIGSGSNPIFIGRSSASSSYSAIWSGKKSSFNANASGFYIGTDGISLGSLNSNGESRFQVTNAGNLTAREGHIGGWTINRNTLKAGNVIFNSNGNLSGTNWYINNDGSCKFGNLTISSNGYVTANGGTFTNITANGGTFNDITANRGTFTDIRANGGTFNNITVYGRINGSSGGLSGGTISGTTVNGSNIVGGTINIGDRLKVNEGSGGPELSNKIGYLTLGNPNSNHPWASGMNVNGANGIAFWSGNQVNGSLGTRYGSLNYDSVNNALRFNGDWIFVEGKVTIGNSSKFYIGEDQIKPSDLKTLASGITYEDVFRAGALLDTDIRLRFRNGILVYSSAA